MIATLPGLDPLPPEALPVLATLVRTGHGYVVRVMDRAQAYVLVPERGAARVEIPRQTVADLRGAGFRWAPVARGWVLCLGPTEATHGH